MHSVIKVNHDKCPAEQIIIIDLPGARPKSQKYADICDVFSLFTALVHLKYFHNKYKIVIIVTSGLVIWWHIIGQWIFWRSSGYIDVSDGWWIWNMLVTTLIFWWRFRLFRSSTSTFFYGVYSITRQKFCEGDSSRASICIKILKWDIRFLFETLIECSRFLKWDNSSVRKF